MRFLYSLFKLTSHINARKAGIHDVKPQKKLKFQIDQKWVYPDKKVMHHPSNTGDLTPLPSYSNDTIILDFQNSQELKSCSEDVKKLFSLGYHHPINHSFLYSNELINKVKRHQYDTTSIEVDIARTTALIRFLQPIMDKEPKRKHIKILLLIEKRKKYLELLRLMDYKKFEWLLEQLELEYKPEIEGDKQVTRKKSLTLLVKLKIERQKEEKLAALKKELDEKKVPFLEKKLKKLQWIKDMEEKNNLTQTVTEKDINECIQKLEKVRIEVEERMKKEYVRKIHPYFLEPYEEEQKNAEEFKC